MMSLTGADILLRCLRAQGVRAVFGMPGTQNVALYDAFHRSGDGIAHYPRPPRTGGHDDGQRVCADDRRGGCRVHRSWSRATNAATGILDALTDCIPVLLVVGGYDRPVAWRDRTKMFHGLDQQALFRPITRYYGRPESVADIPDVVEQAFQAMFSGRHGPAVIEIPPGPGCRTGRR